MVGPWVFGGGGRNRTAVRKSSTDSSTYLAWLFVLVRNPPTGRLVADEPLGFRALPRGEEAPLAHVNDSAVDCSTRPMSKPVRSPAGVRRLERNARRWRLLLSSGFTRELVLGMHCSALRPTSKPGRPHVRDYFILIWFASYTHSSLAGAHFGRGESVGVRFRVETA
jgi:hypothetical protein